LFFCRSKYGTIFSLQGQEYFSNASFEPVRFHDTKITILAEMLQQVTTYAGSNQEEILADGVKRGV
jgi:hypothetical protein